MRYTWVGPSHMRFMLHNTQIKHTLFLNSLHNLIPIDAQFQE